MIRNLTISAVTTAALLCAGCADIPGIAPDAKMMNASALAPGRAVLSARKIQWPDAAWWKNYRDPQLNAIVARAVSGNPVVKTARERVALAASMAGYLHSEQLPHADLDAYSSRERFTSRQFIPPPWGGHTEWNNGLLASFSYDLDLWGRLASAWQASIDEVSAKSAEEQAVRIEIENAVVRSYARLALEYELRDIAAGQYAELKLRESIEKQRFDAGLGTEMALSEAQSLLPLAQAKIESIDAQIAFLKSELASLAGEGPGSSDRIARPSLSLDRPAGLPDRLPANLIGKRPDVRASRWEVEAAGSRIASAKAAFYPNIDLTAATGFLALGGAQFVSQAAFTAGVGPALSLPLFDGGRRRAVLSAATSSYDIAVDRYNATVLRALKDVSDQLVSYRTEAGRQADAENALGLARHASALAAAAYHAGLSNYLRVLAYEDIVLAREEALARIRAAKLESYAKLMLALGGGVK